MSRHSQRRSASAAAVGESARQRTAATGLRVPDEIELGRQPLPGLSEVDGLTERRCLVSGHGGADKPVGQPVRLPFVRRVSEGNHSRARHPVARQVAQSMVGQVERVGLGGHL
jgi:hypothetical protein